VVPANCLAVAVLAGFLLLCIVDGLACFLETSTIRPHD